MLRLISHKISTLLNQQHLGELIRGGATTFYLRFIGYGIGLLLILLISRVYGAKVLGEYSLAITVLTLSSIVARLGFDTSIVKLFSQRVKKNDWGGIKHIYKSILQINFITGIIFSTILFFGSDFLAEIVFKKPDFHTHIKIISILILPLSLRLINAESYRGFKNMKGFAYSKHISYFLYALVILVALTLYSKNNLNPILAFAAGLLILCISSTISLFKKLNSHKPFIKSIAPSYKSLISLSVPMLLSSASLVIAGHLTKFLLGVYVSEEQLGIYNAALSTVTIQSFVMAAINSIAGPKFAEAHHQNNFLGLQQIAKFASNINVYLTIPLTIILILFNKIILSIFGPEFNQGSTAFIIMLIGNSIAVLSGPVGLYMNMTGMQNLLRNIIWISLLISFILALYLIPKFGIIGGAVSIAVFSILWNITGSTFIKIKTGVRTFYWPFKKTVSNA